MSMTIWSIRRSLTTSFRTASPRTTTSRTCAGPSGPTLRAGRKGAWPHLTLENRRNAHSVSRNVLGSSLMYQKQKKRIENVFVCLRFLFFKNVLKTFETWLKTLRQKHENAKNVFSTFSMQFLQKYENVEKTFWKRWLCERVFFENVSKTFWKRCAIREVFFHTPTKTFWKRWLSRLFFCNVSRNALETFSAFFLAPWKENVLKTKKNAGNVFAGGRTDKNEKKTKKKRNGNVRGVFKGLSLFFVRGLLFVRSVWKRNENVWKRIENAMKTHWKRNSLKISTKPRFQKRPGRFKNVLGVFEILRRPLRKRKIRFKTPSTFSRVFSRFFSSKIAWKRKTRLETQKTF